MKTTKLIIALVASVAIGCGGKNNDNNGTNNGTVGSNNGTTAGSNNGTAGSNNGTTAGSNNGTTAGTNNGTTAGTNNGTTGGTNNNTTGPDPTCESYCDLMEANCTGDNAQYENRAACISYCNDVGGWDTGAAGETVGNTLGCREYHAGDPASMDAALHCPHAGPTGGDVCGSWCDNYCTLALNNCTDANELYPNEADCMTACAGFETDGMPNDLEYDTVQCRIYHAGAPAASDAATHCPHAGETPTAFCVGAPEDFNFRTDAPGAYTRTDRMGMPAISTAVVTDKTAYNDGDPATDAAGTYLTDIVTTLTGLHTALDDDILAVPLVPCTMSDLNNDNLPDCLGQPIVTGGPTPAALVVPDTITLDTTAAAGFPNGRLLTDPVIDVTLAIVLLDMTIAAQDPTTLVGVLNPTMNDLGAEGAFQPTFPYLWPPHTP